MRRPSLRAALLLSTPFVVGAALVIGCGDDEGTPGPINQGGTDASIDRRGTGNTSGGPVSDDDDSTDDDDDVTDEDAGKKPDAADAGKKTNPLKRDAAGPGAENDVCSFNWDCQLGLRCECAGECACKPGTRGTGKPGSACEDFNDCVSAVCLDGPNDELLCSDECKTSDNCPAQLPLCQDVAFVGKICVRTPPQ